MIASRLVSTIQSKLIIIYVLLILFAMQLIGVYFVRTLESFFITNFSDSLRKQTVLLSEFVEPYLTTQASGMALASDSYRDINSMVDKLFTVSGAEIQVLDSNGIVLSTSLEAHRSFIGKKNTQTEVSRALQGVRDNEMMIIDAEGTRKKVIAMPVGGDGKIVGAVYIVASMEDLYQDMRRINQIFISGTVIALVLTALLGVMLAHTITKPIKQMRKSATAIADGDFNQFVSVHGEDEIGQLADSFNFMTSRLKEALTNIEEEKEKLALVLTNMSDGVIAADEYGRVIVMNRQARKMLLIEEQEGVRRNMAKLLDMSWSKIKEYAEVGYVLTDSPNVRISFTTIRRKDKATAGIVAVLQDVTKQEQLEQQRRDFVANVSHELRTPLTTIRSYLEALDEGALAEAELAKRFVGVTRNETERMIRLVEDLLQLSQLERPEAQLKLQTIKAQELLEEVADRFSFKMEQKQLTCRVHADTVLPPVLADRDQMDQVLDNLLSNAIKFTPEHGSVDIVAEQDGEHWVKVSVADTGIGIPEQDIQYIFDRFYRADKARSRHMGGTGLGLSIAQKIIHAHGGTISLSSQLNRGTVVAFTLPIAGRGGRAHD
jgi:two-component system sensor histidine kinase VicK